MPMSRKVAMLVGVSMVLAGCDVGTESPSAAAETSASAAAATLIEPYAGNIDDSGQDLAAGRYYVTTPFPLRLTFEVPDGVLAWAYTEAGSQVNLATQAGELSFEIVNNVVADPCSTEPRDPPVGPSVGDLVTALSDLEGFEATAATDVTIDGYDGKQFTLTAPGEGDRACQEMKTWSTTTRQNGVGAGEVAEIRVVDVDGVRLLVALAYGPPLADDDRSRFEGILDSVQLEP